VQSADLPPISVHLKTYDNFHRRSIMRTHNENTCDTWDGLDYARSFILTSKCCSARISSGGLAFGFFQKSCDDKN
jgi:hypothetical protein